MIRIGMFVDTYFPMIDGVIKVVHHYSTLLSEDEEFEVIVFCPKTQDKKYQDGFPYRVERCKSVKIFFLDYCLPLPRTDRRFKKALKNGKLDIVHIHSPFGVGAMGVRYAKKHNIPCIATMHSQFEQDFYRTTKSRLITKVMLRHVMKVFNACDECFTVNPAVARIFYGYGAKRMPGILQNCADIAPSPDSESACARVNEKYNLAPDTPVLLFVGRMTALKNIYFIVDALAKLKTENYKMIFVGDGQDLETLKKKVRENHLKDRVIFSGTVADRDELRDFYCRAKLFLFPSVYDTNSLVQLEAASQGTPTVFIEGAATASSVRDGVNGFIASATPDAYAEVVDEILSDDGLYESVRKNVKKDLYRTWSDTVSELKEVYRRLSDKKNPEK